MARSGVLAYWYVDTSIIPVSVFSLVHWYRWSGRPVFYVRSMTEFPIFCSDPLASGIVCVWDTTFYLIHEPVFSLYTFYSRIYNDYNLNCLAGQIILSEIILYDKCYIYLTKKKVLYTSTFSVISFDFISEVLLDNEFLPIMI